MKLTDIQTWVTVPPTAIGGSFWVLLQLKTDNGLEGIGECYGIPVSGDIACNMIEDTFYRFIAGADPHRIEMLFRKIYSAGFTGRPDISMMGVFSGIEMAIWDILGKAHNVPTYQLLGGRFHDKLRTYTYLYNDILDNTADAGGDVYHNADLAAKAALKYKDKGFTAIKQDPAGPYSFQGGRELSIAELVRTEVNIKAIREAVGDKMDILLGTHGQMTTSSAIRLAQRVEAFDPLWFEEPCPPDQLESLQTVANATTIPIATGERLTTKTEFHRALVNGATILQPNVGRSGGLWETKKIAALAELYNAQIAPHIYCGPVAYAAAAHLAFTLPNFLILETIHTEFHDALVNNKRLHWEEGYLHAPTDAGLGIELNLDVIQKHSYKSGGRLHLEMCQTPLPSDNIKTIDQLESD